MYSRSCHKYSKFINTNCKTQSAENIAKDFNYNASNTII